MSGSAGGGLEKLSAGLSGLVKKTLDCSVSKFFVLTAGTIFWPISRVMGVINEFGFRCSASFTDGLTTR